MQEFFRFGKLSGIQLLKHKVYEAIKKSIIDLSLPPDEQLVEQRLAGELGVSKSPIREALHRLEREGLVYTLPFRGCFVAKITEKEIREVFQLREALEAYCVKNACEHFSEQEINGAKEILTKAEKCLGQEDIERCYSLNLQFHDFIISHSRNERIILTYSTLLDHLDRYRNIGKHITGRVAKSHREHVIIIEALEKRDSILAERRISEHLRSVLKEFLESKELESFSHNWRFSKGDSTSYESHRRQTEFAQ